MDDLTEVIDDLIDDPTDDKDEHTEVILERRELMEELRFSPGPGDGLHVGVAGAELLGGLAVRRSRLRARRSHRIGMVRGRGTAVRAAIVWLIILATQIVLDFANHHKLDIQN